MNSTSLVGGIAILMIFAAGLGGPNGLSGVKASAFEAPIVRSGTPILQSFWIAREMGLSSDSQNELSRHVQIVIDGKVYSGTLFAEMGAR